MFNQASGIVDEPFCPSKKENLGGDTPRLGLKLVRPWIIDSSYRHTFGVYQCIVETS